MALVQAGVFVPAAQFVDDVRQAAGFRASPRQIGAALEEMTRAGQPVTADAVADVVSGSRGELAERQHRHAVDWRALGAALAVRGMDGSPQGQRAFIGAARRTAGPHANDALLLSVALAIAGERSTLDPELVGKVARRIAKSAGDLTPDDIAALAMTELRNVIRSQRRVAASRRSATSAARRVNPRSGEVQTRKPGKRAWAPGGRRRRTIRFGDRRGEPRDAG
jgi:hypothetical protein